MNFIRNNNFRKHMYVFSIIAVIYLQISNESIFMDPEFKLNFLHISFCIFPSD